MLWDLQGLAELQALLRTHTLTSQHCCGCHCFTPPAWHVLPTAGQNHTYTITPTNSPWNASQWIVPPASNYPSTGRNAWLWYAKVTFTVPAGNPALFVVVDRGYPGDMVTLFDSTGTNVSAGRRQRRRLAPGPMHVACCMLNMHIYDD